jgi:excisionase family DNA binding protein
MIILQLDSDQLQTIMQNAIRKVISEQTKQESNSNSLEGKDLLTITEAAGMLSLAKPTIYGLVCQSKIPCMKRGKKLYFSRKELTEWIKQGKKKTIAEMQKDADTYLATKKKRG